MGSDRQLNAYLLKVNRAIVWLLLALMIALMVTGYGLTKPTLVRTLTLGLVDYQAASQLHSLLDAPLSILLVVHVLIEVKFTLVRWGFTHRRLLNLLVALLATISLVFIVYLEGAIA